MSDDSNPKTMAEMIAEFERECLVCEQEIPPPDGPFWTHLCEDCEAQGYGWADDNGLTDPSGDSFEGTPKQLAEAATSLGKIADLLWGEEAGL